MEFLIVIPTYNEFDNIEPLVSGIKKYLPSAHVLFVDDNSADGTQNAIEKLMANDKESVFLLKRPGKAGLGKAYLAGFAWALEHGYKYICQMDADLSHNPKYLPMFRESLNSHHGVIGSRYVGGGGVLNWSWYRLLISRFGSLYARFILKTPINDFTGGFNAWQAAALSSLDLLSITSEGYSFQIELKYRAFLKKYSLHEIPIVFEERRAGQSKMSLNIVIEAIFKVWELKRSLKSFYTRDQVAR